ncbi:MAG: Ycf51 family protein [Cyanobacteria bacterium P01_E01_bin.35]
MTFSTDLFLYAQWSGIATLVCLLVAIVSFVVGWSFRFRLVGVTSFMGVLTAGIFALGLGLFPHTEIPGAVSYSLIYDSGANLAVVAVPPDIEKSAIEPTLIQAATDLYSYGRTGVGGNNQFTVRLRTVLHPQEGVSQPLFLGQAKRMLINQGNQDIETKVFEQNLQQLPSSL